MKKSEVVESFYSFLIAPDEMEKYIELTGRMSEEKV